MLGLKGPFTHKKYIYYIITKGPDKRITWMPKNYASYNLCFVGVRHFVPKKKKKTVKHRFLPWLTIRNGKTTMPSKGSTWHCTWPNHSFISRNPFIIHFVNSSIMAVFAWLPSGTNIIGEHVACHCGNLKQVPRGQPKLPNYFVIQWSIRSRNFKNFLQFLLLKNPRRVNYTIPVSLFDVL